jgi:hypothetical protein
MAADKKVVAALDKAIKPEITAQMGPVVVSEEEQQEEMARWSTRHLQARRRPPKVK